MPGISQQRDSGTMRASDSNELGLQPPGGLPFSMPMPAPRPAPAEEGTGGTQEPSSSPGREPQAPLSPQGRSQAQSSGMFLTLTGCIVLGSSAR